jgi:hypothetical protein
LIYFPIIFRLQYQRFSHAFGQDPITDITDYTYPNNNILPNMILYYANLMRDIDSHGIQNRVAKWTLIPIATNQKGMYIVHTNWKSSDFKTYFLGSSC